MKTLSILLTILFSLNAQISEKNTREFTKIDISLNAITKVSFGKEHSFEINGHEDDLEKIEYSIRNGTLYIEMENKRNWNWFRKSQREALEIRITLVRLKDLDISGEGEFMLPMLDQEDLTIDLSGTVDLETGGRVNYLTIDKSGAGSIYLKDLKSKRVNIDKSGVGSFEINGTAERLKIDCSGASTLDFEDFVVNKLEVDMSGANRLRITVTDEVSADLSGACSVAFKGDAEIIYKDLSGASSVKRMRN